MELIDVVTVCLPVIRLILVELATFVDTDFVIPLVLNDNSEKSSVGNTTV